MKLLLSGALLLNLCACGMESAQPSEIDTTRQSVVYGNDNRTDAVAHPDAALRALALRSSVALVASRYIDMDALNNGIVSLYGAWNGAQNQLCSDERFYWDQTAAYCSGTLISDDLVLTSANCFSAECDGTKFLFNYYNASAGRPAPITLQDVFSCRQVVAREQSQTVDYAVIRLDRSATPRFTPAAIDTTDDGSAVGIRYAVVGYSSGLPAKIDSSSAVRSTRNATRDFFVLGSDTDTLWGGSGSGVYSPFDYRLKGILARGSTVAYKYDSQQGCNRVNVEPEVGGRGEDAVYVRRALDGLCRAEPGNSLCHPSNTLVFDAVNTNSATTNTQNKYIYLQKGQTLTAGTWNISGAQGTGDTFLRLNDASGVQVAANDDAARETYLSRFVFTAPNAGVYVLAAGCYDAGRCSGTVAYELSGTPKLVHRKHFSCDGLKTSDDEVIDIAARNYSNYTCTNRFEAQCINDGSFDGFYWEYCDY